MDRFDDVGLWDKRRRKRRFLLDENYSFKTNPKFKFPSMSGTINEPENLDLLRERRKPLWGENYRAEEKSPLPELKRPIREQSKPGVYDYWKQPVIRGKGGKGGLPLDLGVTLGGMFAHSIAPREWGGRMGEELANLGGQTYRDRMEYEGGEPERELQRRLLRAQITKAEEPGIPSEWEAYKTGTEAERAVVENYKGLGKTQKTNEGFNKIGDKWYSGIWEGDKFTPQREAAASEAAKLDKEVVKGKTFYERAPEKWEEMEKKKAELGGKPSEKEKRETEKRKLLIDLMKRGYSAEEALEEVDELYLKLYGKRSGGAAREIQTGKYLEWWNGLTPEERQRYLKEQRRRSRQGIDR